MERGGQLDAPHVLRHTSASWFVAQGYDLAEVSSYLGMRVGTLTRVYWHRSPHFQRNISQTAQKTPKKPMNRQ